MRSLPVSVEWREDGLRLFNEHAPQGISMICVSVGRGRHKHVAAEHRHLVEQGAPLVELRLDYINGEVKLPRILPDRPGPVVVTCRRARDGGKWTGDEPSRLLLLRAAIAAGVEYIDLEEDIASQIPRYGATKRIISLHDFRKTPENLEEIHARLASLDADIVKLATLANSPHDNVRMLRLIENSKIPTVAICMGDMGTPSRILAGKFGAPLTYATFHQERSLAPGQLSYEQMFRIYRYHQITPSTQVYGVVADPIGHSLSPLLHNAAFQDADLDCVYVPFRVPAEDLDTFLDEAPALGVRGLSVTIPHKEAVVPRLKKMDKAVKGIGAANTILFQEDGLFGYNTDYRAAMDSLEALLRQEGLKKEYLAGKKALVLGAGGAAKAIAFGLLRREMKVHVSGRTRERANSLAARIGCQTIDWDNRHSLRPHVLVNCTPVGMHPHVDETPFDKSHLQESMIVFDTVYNPEHTLLVKEARAQSCKVITGVEMFVRQAALQFELFTEHEPPAKLMRETLKRATGAAKF